MIFEYRLMREKRMDKFVLPGKRLAFDRKKNDSSTVVDR